MKTKTLPGNRSSRIKQGGHPEAVDVTSWEQEKKDALKRCRMFRDLPQWEIEQVALRGDTIFLEKNHHIFCEGQSSSSFFVVQDGLVKVYKTAPSGRHVTFTIAGPGDTLNAAALFQKSHFMSAQALSNVLVVRVRRTEYVRLLSTYPFISMNLCVTLSARLDLEYSRTVSILSELVEHRLAVCLLELFRKFGAHIPITREELANCAGTSTETCIRITSVLKKQGIIHSSHLREIIISDSVALERFVNG